MMNTPQTYQSLYLVKFGYDTFMFTDYTAAKNFFEAVSKAVRVRAFYDKGADLVLEGEAALELSRVTNTTVADSIETAEAFSQKSVEAIA